MKHHVGEIGMDENDREPAKPAATQLATTEQIITERLATLLQGVNMKTSERVKMFSRFLEIGKTLTMQLMVLFKNVTAIPGETKRKLVKDVVAAWINTYITDDGEKIRLLTWVHGSDQLIDLMVKQFPAWFKLGTCRKWCHQLKCCFSV